MAKKQAPQTKLPPKSNAPSQPYTPENKEQMEEPKPLSSSMVATAAFTGDELEILFQSGSEENYKATQKEFEELMQAPSPGKWMWAKFQPHPFGLK